MARLGAPRGPRHSNFSLAHNKASYWPQHPVLASDWPITTWVQDKLLKLSDNTELADTEYRYREIK